MARPAEGEDLEPVFAGLDFPEDERAGLVAGRAGREGVVLPQYRQRVRRRPRVREKDLAGDPAPLAVVGIGPISRSTCPSGSSYSIRLASGGAADSRQDRSRECVLDETRDRPAFAPGAAARFIEGDRDGALDHGFECDDRRAASRRADERRGPGRGLTAARAGDQMLGDPAGTIPLPRTRSRICSRAGWSLTFGSP